MSLDCYINIEDEVFHFDISESLHSLIFLTRQDGVVLNNLGK